MEEIKNQIDSGDHYTALQSLKAKINRLKKRNTPKNREAITDLAFSGSTLLLNADQSQSAFDLLQESFPIITEPSANEIDSFILVLQVFSEKRGQEKLVVKICEEGLEWTSKSSTLGNPRIHFFLGQGYRRLGKTDKALSHLVKANNVGALASFLQDLAKASGQQSEADMLLARGMLNLLSLANLKEANELFDIWNLPTSAEFEPLRNFLKFLLRTLERDAPELFKVLREKYASVLKSDPKFDTLLDRVGERFYNIRPEPAQNLGMNGMMQNMMKMFN